MTDAARHTRAAGPQVSPKGRITALKNNQSARERRTVARGESAQPDA
jgi:hypothetical protein